MSASQHIITIDTLLEWILLDEVPISKIIIGNPVTSSITFKMQHVYQ